MDSMDITIETIAWVTDLTSSKVSCLSNNYVKLTSQKTWQNAIDNCKALWEWWRLPTKDEVIAIWNATTCNTGLSFGSDTYWSITPYTTTNPDISADFAYHIHMSNRSADNDYKTHLNYVVCIHP
jgi:hypothetical protein